MKFPVLLMACLILSECGPAFDSEDHKADYAGSVAIQQEQAQDREDQRQREARDRLDDWYLNSWKLECLSLVNGDAQSLAAMDRCDIGLQEQYHDAETKAGLPYRSLNASSGGQQQQSLPPLMTIAPPPGCSWGTCMPMDWTHSGY